MTIKILVSNKKGEPVFCGSCGTRMIKTPQVSGDYYICNGKLVLQSHCPSCGVMIPNVKDRDINFFSKNQKKVFAVKVAQAYRLGYMETKEIAKEISEKDKETRQRSFLFYA